MNAVARRLRLIPRAPKPQPKPGTWGPLAPPVDPMETFDRSRAQSALCGLTFRDDSTCCPPLSLDQARDVLAWYRPSY